MPIGMPSSGLLGVRARNTTEAAAGHTDRHTSRYEISSAIGGGRDTASGINGGFPPIPPSLGPRSGRLRCAPLAASDPEAENGRRDRREQRQLRAGGAGSASSARPRPAALPRKRSAAGGNSSAEGR